MKNKNKDRDIEDYDGLTLNQQLDYSFEKSLDFSGRVIRISGVIGSEIDFEFIDAALSELERISDEAITIKINSPGGGVDEALAIVGRITSSPCHIVTEGYGAIMSAATLILACGDRRRMSRFAKFMHHESSYGSIGRHTSIKNEVSQMEREEHQWAEWMSEMSNEDAEFWYKKGINLNTYFNAEKCKKLGVVDEVF
jgi:ATP-dependent Clp protease protease subunit